MNISESNRPARVTCLQGYKVMNGNVLNASDHHYNHAFGASKKRFACSDLHVIGSN